MWMNVLMHFCNFAVTNKSTSVFFGSIFSSLNLVCCFLCCICCCLHLSKRFWLKLFVSDFMLYVVNIIQIVLSQTNFGYKLLTNTEFPERNVQAAFQALIYGDKLFCTASSKELPENSRNCGPWAKKGTFINFQISGFHQTVHVCENKEGDRIYPIQLFRSHDSRLWANIAGGSIEDIENQRINR